MTQNNFEQMFLSFLGSSGEMLQWELDNNINLAEYSEQKNPKVFSAAGMLLAFIPKKTKEEMFKDITSESILDILRRKKQDFYKIIITHPNNGRVWVHNQIQNFKKRFL